MAEHVLLCFRSRDPQVSLEPVVQDPDTETEEATWAGVQDVVKLVTAQFERTTEDV